MTVIEISCLEVWREISNYVDQDVAPELRARMEAHFKSCAHCKAVLDGTKNVVKLVADGVEFEIPKGFSDRLYSKIKGK
jgi:anti-sigma factor RsiW